MLPQAYLLAPLLLRSYKSQYETQRIFLKFQNEDIYRWYGGRKYLPHVGGGFDSDVGAGASVVGFKYSKIGEKGFMQGFNKAEVVPGVDVTKACQTRVRF